jgi:hypothetical protein
MRSHATLTKKTRPNMTLTSMARCRAVKGNGEQCKNNAIRGGTVCAQAHGGRAPQVRIAAQRRLATQEAAAVVAKHRHGPIDDPATELLTVASEFLELKTELGRRSAELSTLTATDKHGAQQISAILGAYQASLVQVADVLVKINKLGLEHRRTLVAEQDLANVVAAIRAAVHCSEAHLTYEQAQAVLKALSDELKRL